MNSIPILLGKHAVVFGAGGSIGSAVAKEFAAEGAEVFLCGRTESAAEAVAKEITVGAFRLVMRSKPVNEGLFLALGLLFAYSAIWDVFWWGWRDTTAVVLVCTYICFGMTLRFLLPRFRWIVRSVLWLSLLFWTPQVLLTAPWESYTPRFWCLLAALPCFVFLLISTRRIPAVNG